MLNEFGRAPKKACRIVPEEVQLHRNLPQRAQMPNVVSSDFDQVLRRWRLRFAALGKGRNDEYYETRCFVPLCDVGRVDHKGEEKAVGVGGGPEQARDNGSSCTRHAASYHTSLLPS